MSRKLLVFELWGMGDLAIATPFFRSAIRSGREVVLLAKPIALELQPVLWPGLRIIPFVAPWTSFYGKYRIWRWNWRDLLALRKQIRDEQIECAVSRFDPRDHLLMRYFGVSERVGFANPRVPWLLNCPAPPPPRTVTARRAMGTTCEAPWDRVRSP